MSTLIRNTIALTIPIYRDEDDDLLNYSTEDGRVLPGDCYGPLIEAVRPVCADVVIHIDTTTDAEGFIDRDVAYVGFRVNGNPLYVHKTDKSGVARELAEFFRDEIERVGL